MAPANSLAALVDNHLRLIGMSIADAARKAGLSYRQMYRIVNGDSVHVQPSTLDGLERLGLDRRTLAIAAYNNVDELTPQEAPAT